MPPKKYKQGDLVFVKMDGEVKTYEVVIEIDCSGSYVLADPNNPLSIVTVDESRMMSVYQLHNKQRDVQRELMSVLNEIDADSRTFLSNLSDEELEALVPVEKESSVSQLGAQEEYNMLCTTMKSEWSILTMLIEFANSDKKLGDVALLAMRDSAEGIGNSNIVNAIDAYMESADII